ncbi:MAG: hypothetical protein WBL63_18240 [Candidatus Acidiferrum sp.]
MKPSLRVLVRFVFFVIVAAVVMVCEGVWAQNPEKPAEPAKTQKPSGPKKPKRASGWVNTNDSIVGLAARGAPREAAAEAAKSTSAESKEASGAVEEPASKAAEIAVVEKQIQEKQKQIVLLMRLFVKDERPFLNDPGNANGDSAAQERRKYEQDELLWETAELARLRGRLQQLTAAGKENAAAKP